MTKILVIEDEESIRDSIVDTLELEGYETDSAADGMTGVELARRSLPDMIICDIMMNDLDGFGVLKMLHDDPTTATIPFVFVTAKADRESVRQGMQMGADDYLVKPFTSVELLETIVTRLERHRSIAQYSEEKLVRIRQQLMQIVTRDIHDPLETINSVVELVSRQMNDIQPDDLHELLDAISVSSRHLNRIVEQIRLLTLLETGGITQGTITEENSTKRLWEVLIAAIDMARLFISERIDVAVRLNEQDARVMVQCDPDLLKHALAEVIANAIHFSPENSEVVVAQWSTDDGIWVSVSDVGPGISEHVLQQVFGDVEQIISDNPSRQGLGMGLLLARRIVEVHRGQFDINSVADEGTEITINLPPA